MAYEEVLKKLIWEKDHQLVVWPTGIHQRGPLLSKERKKKQKVGSLCGKINIKYIYSMFQFFLRLF